MSGAIQLPALRPDPLTVVVTITAVRPGHASAERFVTHPPNTHPHTHVCKSSRLDTSASLRRWLRQFSVTSVGEIPSATQCRKPAFVAAVPQWYRIYLLVSSRDRRENVRGAIRCSLVRHPQILLHEERIGNPRILENTEADDLRIIILRVPRELVFRPTDPELYEMSAFDAATRSKVVADRRPDTENKRNFSVRRTSLFLLFRVREIPVRAIIFFRYFYYPRPRGQIGHDHHTDERPAREFITPLSCIAWLQKGRIVCASPATHRHPGVNPLDPSGCSIVGTYMPPLGPRPALPINQPCHPPNARQPHTTPSPHDPTS